MILENASPGTVEVHLHLNSCKFLILTVLRLR